MVMMTAMTTDKANSVHHIHLIGLLRCIAAHAKNGAMVAK